MLEIAGLEPEPGTRAYDTGASSCVVILLVVVGLIATAVAHTPT